MTVVCDQSSLHGLRNLENCRLAEFGVHKACEYLGEKNVTTVFLPFKSRHFPKFLGLGLGKMSRFEWQIQQISLFSRQDTRKLCAHAKSAEPSVDGYDLQNHVGGASTSCLLNATKLIRKASCTRHRCYQLTKLDRYPSNGQHFHLREDPTFRSTKSARRLMLCKVTLNRNP